MKKVSTYIILIFCCSFLNIYSGEASRAIPADNISQSVSITLGDNSKASGFYLNYKDKYICLISAKHVFFENTKDGSLKLKSDSANLLSYSSKLDWANPIELELDLKTLNEQGYIKYHMIHDVVAIKLAVAIPEERGHGHGDFLKGVRQVSKNTILV